jgi:hypothetical protein
MKRLSTGLALILLRPESIGRRAKGSLSRRSLGLRSNRLELVGGFTLFRSFGIDRLDAPAHAAERGSAALGSNFCSQISPPLSGCDHRERI